MKRCIVLILGLLCILQMEVVNGQTALNLNQRNSDSIAEMIVTVMKVKYGLNKDQESTALKCTQKYYKSIAGLGNQQLEIGARGKRIAQMDQLWKDELSKIMTKDKFQQFMDDEQKRLNKIRQTKSPIKQAKTKGQG